MEPHQLRVVEEKKELDEKLSKLSSFLQTQIFASLPEAEQIRLNRQENIMKEYAGILGERINNF